MSIWTKLIWCQTNWQSSVYHQTKIQFLSLSRFDLNWLSEQEFLHLAGSWFHFPTTRLEKNCLRNSCLARGLVKLREGLTMLSVTVVAFLVACWWVANMPPETSADYKTQVNLPCTARNGWIQTEQQASLQQMEL